MRFRSLVFVVGVTLAGFVHAAGPYAPAAGQPGSTAVSENDASIVGWATGYQDYLPNPAPGNVSDAFRTPEKALGKADGSSIVSLGDSGSITLTFGGAIFNGAGNDFAVFENSFSSTFLELAWVEVSSDGAKFFRFPGFSLTANPVNGFGTVDPTNIDGLAGKYQATYGTPFDLALLNGVPGLDINNVRYVRIVDILGDGSVLDNYPPSSAACPSCNGPHPIYDPTPTTGSAGFDLDAVGVMHLAPVPEPSMLALLCVGALMLWSALRARRRGQFDSTRFLQTSKKG